MGRLCVALDGSDRDWIEGTARQVSPTADWLKIGLEAFTAHGPDLVRQIVSIGIPVFLDLKLHDIPTTVARAVANCSRLGARMLNVHAAGGREMMEAAVEAARWADPSGETRIIAVTVLTSIDASGLERLGFSRSPADLVVRWAREALQCGLDGVVASAREAPAVRRACGDDFLIVTPGIRPEWASQDDQCRVVTPSAAVAAGADILVVGRPITTADDPRAAARRVREEMTS